jgi:hypothetical protein
VSWASQISQSTIDAVLLPNLAYLRSARDQTLPARKLALIDAADHFTEAEASGDAHWRDLALLGVIGEAMQILEDLAYVGQAYTGPDRYQLPRYVSATVYSGYTPTTFYQQLKKWSDDRLLEFGGLRVPAGDGYVSLHDLLGAQYRSEIVDAIHDAEAATATQLRAHLTDLAHGWNTFSKYFHAFKHGALVVSRDDFFVADDNGNKIDVEPSISVWDRKKPEGVIWGDTNLTPRQVAEEAAHQGWLAYGIAGYVVEARLAALKMAGFDEEGNFTPPERISIPWQFWVKARDLKPGTRELLREVGIEFADD